VSLDYLRTTRAIAGWCSIAGSLLGSETSNYENIDYSEAEDAGAPPKFTGRAIGFQYFGAAQANFTLRPKDGKCHFHRSGPYKRTVSAAEKRWKNGHGWYRLLVRCFTLLIVAICWNLLRWMVSGFGKSDRAVRNRSTFEEHFYQPFGLKNTPSRT